MCYSLLTFRAFYKTVLLSDLSVHVSPDFLSYVRIYRIVYDDGMLCFRLGSKVDQFDWLVLLCLNVFDIKKKTVHLIVWYVKYTHDA